MASIIFISTVQQDETYSMLQWLELIPDFNHTSLPDNTKYWWFQKDSSGKLTKSSRGKSLDLTIHNDSIYTYVLMLMVPIQDNEATSCQILEKEIKLQAVKCPIFEQTNALEVCAGEVFKLEAFNNLIFNNIAVDYEWTRNGQAIGDSRTLESSINVNTTYQCEVVFGIGCPSLTHHFEVTTKDEPPVPQINTPVCVGFKRDLIMTNNDVGLGAFTGTIQWQELDENNKLIGLSSQDGISLTNIQTDHKYRITATTLGGCETHTDFEIKIFPTEPGIIFGNNKMCNESNDLIAPPGIEGTIYKVTGQLDVNPSGYLEIGSILTVGGGAVLQNYKGLKGGSAVYAGESGPSMTIDFMVLTPHTNLTEIGMISLPYQDNVGNIKSQKFWVKPETPKK